MADDPPTAFVQLPFKQHAQSVREIQAILQEIEGIKAEIDKGSGFLGIFLDKEQLRIRKLLKIRLELSFQRLKELAEGKA